MSPKRKAKTIRGTYRITEMELWDQDYVDAEVEAYIEFPKDGLGRFQFGYIRGWTDGCDVVRDELPAI